VASAKRPMIRSISRMPRCQDGTKACAGAHPVRRSNVSCRSSVPHRLPARGVAPVIPLSGFQFGTRSIPIARASQPPATLNSETKAECQEPRWFRFCGGRHDREMID
jgi:hypothetical protein